MLPISKETRAVNSIGDLNGALDDMPQYCITIGIYEISHARKIRLGCFRDWHRSVVRHAAYGYCITIGIYEISHARKIRLGCFRDWHRSVVRHAAYGERSAHFPVSLLQGHPDITIRLTEFVANLPE